jgi:hypothetical protein
MGWGTYQALVVSRAPHHSEEQGAHAVPVEAHAASVSQVVAPLRMAAPLAVTSDRNIAI